MKDFSTHSDGILKEAMKWAPEWVTSHIQEYTSQMHRNDVWHHAGLSLAMESIMQFSPFNDQSASLSLNTLEKRPKCVKNDLPKVIFVLNMRSKYRGEVRKVKFLQKIVFSIFSGPIICSNIFSKLLFRFPDYCLYTQKKVKNILQRRY